MRLVALPPVTVVADGPASHCGFPSLVWADDTWTVAWRAATNHTPTGAGALYAATSSDGVTWSAPAPVGGPAADHRDPALSTTTDGTLWCAWFTSDTTRPLTPLVAYATGTDPLVWSTPVPVDHGWSWSSAACGPVVELPDGTLLVAGYGADTPAAHAARAWGVRVARSTDHGATWGDVTTVCPADGDSWSETWIGVLPDGTLMALIRCDQATPRIHRSTSSDGGRTWSTPVPVLEGTGRPAWYRTGDGRVITVIRSRLDSSAVLHESGDDGVTWSPPAVVWQAPPVGQSAYTGIAADLAGTIGLAHGAETSPTASTVTFQRIGDATMTTTVTAGPGDIGTTNLPAAVNNSLGSVPCWYFQAGQHAMTILDLPGHWSTANVELVWAPAGVGPGNVAWMLSWHPQSAGATSSLGAWEPGVAIAPAGPTSATIRHTMVAQGVSVTPGPTVIRIHRATTAGDSAVPAALFAIRAHQAT